MPEGSGEWKLGSKLEGGRMKCFQKYSRWLRIYMTSPFESQSSQMKISHKSLTAGNTDLCACKYIHFTSWYCCSLSFALRNVSFLVLCILIGIETWPCYWVLWIENWQQCSCGIIQIPKSRKKEHKVREKKEKYLWRKEKEITIGRQLGVWLTLY